MTSKREQAFVLHYTGDALFNGAEAARRAGYSEKSARITASKLLTKANIKAAIDGRIKELTMGADEVMIRLSEHGRGDISKFINLMPGEIAAHPEARIIKSYERTVTTGRNDFREEKVKVELYSAQAALLHLWKHHRLVEGQSTERVDITDAKERIAQLLARRDERGGADDAAGDTDG